MSCILYHDDKEATEDKINIDDLYEKKQRQDQKQLSIFNKILNRVHEKIKITARKQVKEKWIWCLIPEFIFGQPLYDQGECIGYVVHKLETNGFQCRYVHPNALYVSWAHWIPFYVRNEYKQKTGVTIDEFGNILATPNKSSSTDTDHLLVGGKSNDKKYAVAKGYKAPQGLVYRDDLVSQMGRKLSSNSS